MSRLAVLLSGLLLLALGLSGEAAHAGEAAAVARSGPAWAWPLVPPHAVTRPFGLGPTVYAAGHRGVDLAGAPGQAVSSAGEGQVTYAGSLAGRGVVTVTHGTLRTTYEPVTATVRVGARVTAGEQVGTLEAGHPGCPEMACLHWGLRRGDVYLDPLRLVQQGPVRLLTPGGVSSDLLAARGLSPRGPAVRDLAAREPATQTPQDPARAAARDGRPGVAPDQERAPSGSSSVTVGGPPDQRLASGLTAGAAVVVVAGSSAALRRRDTGRRSRGVGR